VNPSARAAAQDDFTLNRLLRREIKIFVFHIYIDFAPTSQGKRAGQGEKRDYLEKFTLFNQPSFKNAATQ
jgi:hypothetical protein